MDARQLQFFVAVVEKGSFSEAAKSCYVTQPAISAAIRKLESELAVRLIERHPRKIELTVFGQSLYESALGIAADIQMAKANIEALRRPDRGQVRLGIDQTIAPNVITDVASQLLAEFPGMHVEITTGIAWQFEKAILQGDLDFIVAQPPPPQNRSSELDYEPLFREAVFPVANPRHALARKARVRDTDFAEHPWCVLRWIRGHLLWVPDFFAVLDATPPDPLVGSNALSLMRQLLLTTDLIALFPRRLVADDLAAGRLVRIGSRRQQIITTRYLISRRNRHRSPARQAFLDKLLALAASLDHTIG